MINIILVLGNDSYSKLYAIIYLSMKTIFIKKNNIKNKDLIIN